jgi:hypothetical protein
VRKHYFLCIASLLFLLNPEISIGGEVLPLSDKVDIYDYMSKILAPDQDGHKCILDEDIVIYASRLYFEGKHLDSIKILKKVHLDHDSIYWLWKNEIAICDALVNLNKANKTYGLFRDYVAKNTSYFTWDGNLKRYFPNERRLEESKAAYPGNEFLPEMQIYYYNLEKVKELKLKKTL